MHLAVLVILTSMNSKNRTIGMSGWAAKKYEYGYYMCLTMFVIPASVKLNMSTTLTPGLALLVV